MQRKAGLKILRGPSIKDLLIKIEQRLDEVDVIDKMSVPHSIDPLSEVGKYISIDRLLGDLYRQYLEAQKKYIQAIDTHGVDAPITETASYMADSTHCAFETRLYELREDEAAGAKIAGHGKKQRSQAHLNGHINTDYNKTYTSPQNQEFWVLIAMCAASMEQQQVYTAPPPSLDFARVAA